MKMKKKYGEYQSKTCPFCERRATQKNEQGLDVCHKHTKEFLTEIKCLCGEWLEILQGKYGPFFRCNNCGCMNLRKAMEIKRTTDKSKPAVKESIKKEGPKVQSKTTFTKPEKKEIVITTDDVEYFS
jgi:hypothetical protein